MPAVKPRPSFASLAKQIDGLTLKTRRAERGFGYEMRKLKALMRSELQLARQETRRHVMSFRVALTAIVLNVGRQTTGGRRLRS